MTVAGRILEPGDSRGLLLILPPPVVTVNEKTERPKHELSVIN